MTPSPPDRSSVEHLIERVVTAHGGLEPWRRAVAVDLRLSSGGVAFATKGRARALRDVHATVATRGQAVEVSGRLPRPWQVRFPADGPDGADALAGRLARLRRGRRRLAWSVDDAGAFAAAALWTYVQVPFILADPAVSVERLPPWREDGETWLPLAVSFPDRFATHCRRQVLYLDRGYRVRRHDYTALAFGRWARAAQYLSAYRSCDGLSFPTRRRVFPRLPGGRACPWPQLVWIDVHQVTVHRPAATEPAGLAAPPAAG